MGDKYIKVMKVAVSEDTRVWQNLLAYGHELNMQPAETVRVILAEWSKMVDGQTPSWGMMAASVTTSTPVVDRKTEQARVMTLAGSPSSLFDDDE